MKVVTVIVPAYKDDTKLKKCVDALDRQSLGKENYEVLIVNNAAEDISFDLPSSGFRLLTELTPGSYAARNLGLSFASGSIFAFTDSDCIPDPNWLKNGVDELERSQADRIAGAVKVFPRSDRMTPTECYESIFAFDQRSNAERGSAVTANLFARKKVFESVGVFNQDLLSGGDTEWNKRATRHGFSIVYSEEAVVLHPARHSWGELARKIERTMGGKFSLDRNYKISTFRSLMPPIEAARTILKSRSSPRTMLLAFWIAYLIKLHKLRSLYRLRSGRARPSRS